MTAKTSVEFYASFNLRNFTETYWRWQCALKELEEREEREWAMKHGFETRKLTREEREPWPAGLVELEEMIKAETWSRPDGRSAQLEAWDAAERDARDAEKMVSEMF